MHCSCNTFQAQARSHEASIALHCRVLPHKMAPGSRSLLDLRPVPVDLRRELRMGQSLTCSEQQSVRARTGVHRLTWPEGMTKVLQSFRE